MEFRRKCQVCGKVYCYTDADLIDNKLNSASGMISSVAAIANIFGGTMLGAYAMNAQADRETSKVVDYTRCPSCHSASTIALTEAQWVEEQNKLNATATSASATVAPARNIDVNVNASTESLLKRVHLFLEDSDWEAADAYCEKILDVEPENSYAYLGKLMAEQKVHNLDGLVSCEASFEGNGNYKKALRFSDAKLSAELSELASLWTYNTAVSLMHSAKSKDDYDNAEHLFLSIRGYRDADK